MDLYTLFRQMKSLYALCNSALGNTIYVSNIPYLGSYNNVFKEHICKTVPISNLLERASENNKKINTLFKELIEEIKEKYHYKMNYSFDATTRKIFDNYYFFSPNEEIEYQSIIQPIVDTYELFRNLSHQYDKKEMPALLGNNWKLQKIFSKERATKSKTINEKYVLKPEVIDEIINNYFLFIKCGWNPNE